MLALPLVALLVSAEPLPWVHDDWEAAKKKAIAEKKLVAVDVWATWCHTCLSMKNFTLHEPPLAKVAKQHVWLALDYDLEKNAAFFARFPITAFPTFLVVDPEREEVVARWPGSGTSAQMAEFFASAKRSPDDPIAKGAQLLAASQHAAAAALFEQALAEKNLSKPVETRLINGLVEALRKADEKACATRGAELLDRIEDTAPGVDAACLIASCAEALDPAAKKLLLEKVRVRLDRVRGNKAAMASLAVDDRSGFYESLVDIADQLGETAQGDQLTQERLAMLEAAAKSAPDAKTRSTYDAHRLDCYLRLKRYPEAEKMLLASQAAAPKDFNPPWRLAVLAKARGDTAAGLTAIDRALSLGYGPRRFRLHSTKVDLLTQAKRWPEARAAIATAKADLAKLDKALVRAAWTESLDKQAVAIDTAERAATKS